MKKKMKEYEDLKKNWKIIKIKIEIKITIKLMIYMITCFARKQVKILK